MERLHRALSEGEAAGPARCRSQRMKIDDVAAFQRQAERGSVGVDDAIVVIVFRDFFAHEEIGQLGQVREGVAEVLADQMLGFKRRDRKWTPRSRFGGACAPDRYSGSPADRPCRT